MKGVGCLTLAPYRSLPTSPFYPHSRPILTVFGQHQPHYPTVFGKTSNGVRLFQMFRSIPVRSYYVRSLSVQQCPTKAGHIMSENTKKTLPIYLTFPPHRDTLLVWEQTQKEYPMKNIIITATTTIILANLVWGIIINTTFSKAVQCELLLEQGRTHEAQSMYCGYYK